VSNPYSVLGVSCTADAAAIKAAYLALMRRYHPDKAVLEPLHEAEQRSKDVNVAFALLSDPRRRAEYDQALARATRSTQGRGRHVVPSPAEQRRYQLSMATKRRRIRRVRLFQQGLVLAACLVLGLGVWGAIALFEPSPFTWGPGVAGQRAGAPVERVATDLEFVKTNGEAGPAR